MDNKLRLGDVVTDITTCLRGFVQRIETTSYIVSQFNGGKNKEYDILTAGRVLSKENIFQVDQKVRVVRNFYDNGMYGCGGNTSMVPLGSEVTVKVVGSDGRLTCSYKGIDWCFFPCEIGPVPPSHPDEDDFDVVLNGNYTQGRRYYLLRHKGAKGKLLGTYEDLYKIQFYHAVHEKNVIYHLYKEEFDFIKKEKDMNVKSEVAAGNYGPPTGPVNNNVEAPVTALEKTACKEAIGDAVEAAVNAKKQAYQNAMNYYISMGNESVSLKNRLQYLDEKMAEYEKKLGITPEQKSQLF